MDANNPLPKVDPIQDLNGNPKYACVTCGDPAYRMMDGTPYCVSHALDYRKGIIQAQSDNGG